MKILAPILAGALCAFPLAVLAQPAPPLVRAEGLRAVSTHVHVIPDGSVPAVPNVGIVVGASSILVIDTGLGTKNGAAVAEVAQRLAQGRVIYLAATHAHPEHDLGVGGFPSSVKMIRSEAQNADRPNDMAMAETFASRSPERAELLRGAQFRPADILFKDRYDLDLGGVTVTLLAMGPNHTDGDTAFWIGADKVLFSGDLAMKPSPAIMTEKATVAGWLKTLDRLEALQPAQVVPSHGPAGDAGLIRGYRVYLQEVAERTAKAKAGGLTLAQATEAVAAAMVARYPDRRRLEGAIAMAFGR